MRKVVAFEHMTLDGFVDSQQGMGFEWTHRAHSQELGDFHDQHIRSDLGTVAYGRRTFEGMRDYWSSVPGNPDSTPSELAHADWVANVEKIVFSTTLQSHGWTNTRIIGSDAATQARALKAEDGDAVAIYASPTLVHWLLGEQLVDEFRIVIHPVVIGSGTPLFPAKTDLELNLLESKTFDTGAVYLRYQVG